MRTKKGATLALYKGNTKSAYYTKLVDNNKCAIKNFTCDTEDIIVLTHFNIDTEHLRSKIAIGNPAIGDPAIGDPIDLQYQLCLQKQCGRPECINRSLTV